MKSNRREIEGVSLSFLDVISCGFGALILLLVLTKVFEPVILEDTVENLQNYLANLQQQLEQLRGETRVLNRDMIRKDDLDEETLAQLTTLNEQLASLEEERGNLLEAQKVSGVVEEKLATVRQTLTEEMRRLLADYQRTLEDSRIGGIPVDSEYVIFIIDTSGSMFANAWPLVLDKVSETLALYPRLKGIQVMNDMGNYMYPEYAGEWIPDTDARRSSILDRLRYWNVFSNSSPVEGITAAIATYYEPGKKISLYIFGDDFSGRSVQRVVDTVDRINREDEDGERLVRIHAVGFPVLFTTAAQNRNVRFAVLMKILCERNGGTFVGLNDHRLL